MVQKKELGQSRFAKKKIITLVFWLSMIRKTSSGGDMKAKTQEKVKKMRLFSGEVEPLPSNSPQTRNLEEPLQEEIHIDSAIETICNKVQEGGIDTRIRGLAVAIFNRVESEQNKATIISMKYKLPKTKRRDTNQSFAKIPKATRLKGKTKEWEKPKSKAKWISTRVSLLQAILDESCNPEDILLQKEVVAALVESMVGKV